MVFQIERWSKALVHHEIVLTCDGWHETSWYVCRCGLRWEYVWLLLEHLLDATAATVGLLHKVEISHWRMSPCVLVSAVVRLLLGEASAGLLTQTLHDFTSDLWKSVPFNPSLTPCRPRDVKTTFSAFITSRRRAASSARSFSLSWLSWNGWRQSEYALSGNVGNCRDMTWYLPMRMH